MRRLSISVSLLAAVALNFTTSERLFAQSSCIWESMLHQDYCGSESIKISRYVPDRPIGDFRAACAAHDRCYAAGGEQIVHLMEARYRMSLLRITPEQRREFKLETRGMKADCDIRFRADMGGACRNVPLTQRLQCATAANLYLIGVAALAGRAFDQAVDSAFTCRSH